MTDVTLELRQPFAPHQILAIVHYSDLTYGFMLEGVGRASFAVSRADPTLLAQPEAFGLFTHVTIRRSDLAHPWAGYITGTRASLADPVYQFECQEPTGAVMEYARTTKQWAARPLGASEWLQWAFSDASARDGALGASVRLAPFRGGSVIDISPQSDSMLSFLNTLAEHADWEWKLHHRLARNTVVSELVFQRRIGRDYRPQLFFEEGVHFIDAEYIKDASAFITSSLSVGGTGAFQDRPSAQVQEGGASGEVGTAVQPRPSTGIRLSPAASGSSLSVDQAVTNEGALTASAARQSRKRAGEREQFTLKLFEEALDMRSLALGGIYRARFDDIDLGRPFERDVRIVALRLGVDGIVEPVVEVSDAA